MPKIETLFELCELCERVHHATIQYIATKEDDKLGIPNIPASFLVSN